MKNYIKYLVITLLLVIPFKIFASEVTNVYVDLLNKLSFTAADGYNVYQVYLKYGETQIYAYGQNVGAKSNDLANIIMTRCDELVDVCPDNYEGDYTLEIIALDPANAYAEVESTKTTKTLRFKHQEFNGDDFYHVDVVGNETKYTIILDPDNDIDEPQEINNLTFGQHVILSSIESYGFTKLPKRLYYGWEFENFYVTQDMTIMPAWEPLFTMSLNFNGGTFNGEGTYSKDGVGYLPFTSLYNVMHAFEEGNEVIPPANKEIDYITVNGVRYNIDPENGFMFGQDTEIVYYWKWSEGVVVHNVTFTDGFDNVIKVVEVADGTKVTKPENPVIGRLQFVKWIIGEEDYDFNTLVTEDINIEAYWGFYLYVEANAKNVAVFTYNGHDYPDKLGSSGQYHENEIKGIDQRGINGYELVAWHLGSVDGPVVGSDSSADYYVSEGGHLKIKQKPETSDLEFYAVYEKSKVAVNFVTNGGTAIETQYVIPGEYAVEPDLYASLKDGYLLGNWYTDPELTHEYNFFTPVQTELTLYASWNIYISEVKGTIRKPVGGFTADTNIVSFNPDMYTFDFQYWYLTKDGCPHIEGDATFETGNEYEVRTYVIPKPGYAVDHYTKFYINNEETSCYGSAEARQIRWVATAPTEVVDFNISGIVNPSDGNLASIENINLNTAGLVVSEVFWTEENTGNVLTASDKFVAGKRYILHILFNPSYGYILEDGYNEDVIIGAVDYLKAELIDQMDIYEMQIYYEAKGRPVITTAPVVTVANANDNSLLLSWNEVNYADNFEVYRSTSKTSGFTKVATVNENSYTDNDLTYGKTYYYKVKAINNISNKTSSVVSGKTVPNKVENLHVESVGSTNVKVGYDKVNVTGYEVYYGTSTSKMSLAGVVKSNSTLTYNKTGLKANTTYYFKVKAYKTVGKSIIYGAFSDILTVKTGPSAPSVTVSNKDYKSLSIKINSVTGGVNYKLEVSTDKTNYSLVEELPVAGVYVHSDLTPGMTYYYRAKACNSEGSCGSYSSVVSKKVIPNAPVLTVNKNTENKLMIKVNEQEGVTGYHIYRSTSKTKNFKKVGSTETTEYLDTNLTYGTTYYYKVVAYNENSESAYSNVASGKTVPGTVENLKVDNITSTSIKVSYDKVNATGYEVYYGTSTKSMKKATTISNSNTLSYNKTSLKANTTYYFKVRAYKKIGSKKVYGSYSILTVKTAPAVPSITVSNKDYKSLSITIKSVSGASKYVVEKSLDKTNYNILKESSTASTFVDSDLTLDKTYYYRVKSCNASDVCSNWSSVVSKKVILNTPNGLNKTTGAFNANVSYNSVLGAQGYELYRSTSKTKGYTKVADLDSETLSYNDKSLKENKTYYYKVRAYRMVNDTKVYSSYSNILTAKTRYMNSTEKAAVSKAKSYLKETTGYSPSTLFTKLKEASYSDATSELAVEHSGANWKNEAVKVAKRLASEKEYHGFEMLIELGDLGFSDEDGEYGALNAGISYLPDEE